jgi:TPR repeat protein
MRALVLAGLVACAHAAPTTSCADAAACFNSGRTDVGFMPDYSAMLAKLGAACRAGNAQACLIAADVYRTGWGVAQDVRIADFYARRAAELELER